MKISVIIPTYKPQDYLWECLDSLCNQTFDFECFEVILVLNGCNEPYNSKIREYKEAHKIINWQYIQTTQGGVSNARNIALDRSRGDYITFLDDDDWISPNYLEELYKHASPEVIPLCKPLSFLNGTTIYEPYYITKDYERYHNKRRMSFNIPHRFFNGPVYKLIHRDVIGDRRFDVRFKNGEDSLFMFLCSDKFKWVDFADESCVYYRRYRKESASMSKRSFVQRLKNAINLSYVRSDIYFCNIKKYNFKFYIRQIVGSFASAIFNI